MYPVKLHGACKGQPIVLQFDRSPALLIEADRWWWNATAVYIVACRPGQGAAVVVQYAGGLGATGATGEAPVFETVADALAWATARRWHLGLAPVVLVDDLPEHLP